MKTLNEAVLAYFRFDFVYPGAFCCHISIWAVPNSES